MPRFGLCTQLLHRGRNSNMNLIFQLSNDNGSSWVWWGGGIFATVGTLSIEMLDYRYRTASKGDILVLLTSFI